MAKAVSKEIIKAIAEFTTCDAADALQKLKVPHGGFLAGLTMWSPQRQDGKTRIAGPAYTVRYVPKNHENESKPASHFIDSIPADHIVFVSAPPRIPNAVWGGLMSTRAQALGAAGTIIDGRVRDLDEHRALGYPLFARATGTSAPAEVVRVAQVNEPVRLQSEDQEAWIRPGDVLVADVNGVVCVPAEYADERLVELMRSQVEADDRIAADLKAGMSFAESSKKHRSGVKKP